MLIAVAPVIPVASITAVLTLVPGVIVVVAVMISIVVALTRRNDTAGEQNDQTEDQAAASYALDD